MAAVYTELSNKSMDAWNMKVNFHVGTLMLWMSSKGELCSIGRLLLAIDFPCQGVACWGSLAETAVCYNILIIPWGLDTWLQLIGTRHENHFQHNEDKLLILIRMWESCGTEQMVSEQKKAATKRETHKKVIWHWTCSQTRSLKNCSKHVLAQTQIEQVTCCHTLLSFWPAQWLVTLVVVIGVETEETS